MSAAQRELHQPGKLWHSGGARRNGKFETRQKISRTTKRNRCQRSEIRQPRLAGVDQGPAAIR